MSLLLSAQFLSKSYGSQNLFTDISFSLREGDRTALVGPNGAGKSTLLKILSGIEKEDSGHIAKSRGTKLAYVPQFSQFSEGSVLEVALSNHGYGSMEEAVVEARALIHKAGLLDSDRPASELSGGQKKRLDIVRALMENPDLLLLDEPTNHLDLEGIVWLENFLRREKRSYLIVSHDRYFLDAVCTKVLEINRCFSEGFFACDGNWSVFRERRFAFLEARLKEERSLASTVRDEVEWMRRSPKARTCKSKSRMEKGESLVAELEEIQAKNQVCKVEINFASSQRETRNLIVVNNLGKSFGKKRLFSEVTFKLSPGTRLGIVGKNGTGKTTLLQILAGEISPDMGTVKYARDLKLVYFDQHRETIDPGSTLKEALSPNGDFVTFGGREIHVNGWASKFLFSPDRLNLPVHCLSGGERARILIARLMLKPADVLFLDEPTNDLDIATLEVIENSLAEFPGAVVLISHDRFLMNRVCNVILGIGSEEETGIFADYEQWTRASFLVPQKKEKEEKPAPAPPSRSKKISYKEQKELEGMEESIATAEKELKLLQEKTAQLIDSKGSFDLYNRIARAEAAVNSLYERWQILIDKSFLS